MALPVLGPFAKRQIRLRFSYAIFVLLLDTFIPIRILTLDS